MLEPKRLLIIDDDPDIVEGIKSILEGANYEVDVAYNPTDGNWERTGFCRAEAIFCS